MIILVFIVYGNNDEHFVGYGVGWVPSRSRAIFANTLPDGSEEWFWRMRNYKPWWLNRRRRRWWPFVRGYGQWNDHTFYHPYYRKKRI